MSQLSVIELCAGAGGQALGLEEAGFAHRLAIELDSYAAATLRATLGAERVREGDVADRAVWDPEDYRGEVDLLAGGVPCPPFSLAGVQRGALDERDLFAWAVEQVGLLQPRALLLENVRGLAMPRFAAYRQHVLDRLAELGYVGQWRLLHSADFGVPQLRPRFVLVALRPDDWSYFTWPEGAGHVTTVGEALEPLMAADEWPYAREWALNANSVGPTIVGGSKKHGGADLGPTRAKAAWLKLGVDARGVVESPPDANSSHFEITPPRLTIDMVARLQGWDLSNPHHLTWVSQIAGPKTSRYRQIGNAFPPPVASAVGDAIRQAILRQAPQHILDSAHEIHDPMYLLMRDAVQPLTVREIAARLSGTPSEASVLKKIGHISQDFAVIESQRESGELAYSVQGFRAFTGQLQHTRHEYIRRNKARVS